ncbi:MAG: hypothetical protein DYH06_21720, partial [Acidobacteria bacterium ACB2]|nr:hypothetical protein [Acidobacteria bacterium ACB2]
MRPLLRLLGDTLRERIVAEAREVLLRLGVEVHDPAALALLADHGAEVDPGARRARLPGALVEKALGTAP